MSEASPEILYESESLRVVGNGILSPLCFLSFGDFLYRKPGVNFWGDGFFAKYNFGAVGFVSARPDWFPEAEMQKAVAAVQRRLHRRPGVRRVSYGVNMGGYAALKYAALTGADAAIAFSPQISIAPSDVGRFDARYLRYYDRARNGEMRIRKEDLAAENYVLYDNFWTVDRRHAERIAALGAVTCIPLPFTGHASIRALEEGRIAAAFLSRLLGQAEGKPMALRRMVRSTRKSTLVYWESRAVTLTARRPAAGAEILDAVQNALAIRPNAVALQIAEVTALCNVGQREAAEGKLAEISPDAGMPVGQWLGYLECYRRIHGERETIAMMGRVPPEVQSRPAFRFEDAVLRLALGDRASAAAILALIWPAQEEITRRMKLALALSELGEKAKALGVLRALAVAAPTAESLVALAAALAEDRKQNESAREALGHLAEARRSINSDAGLWRRLLMIYDGLDDRAQQLAAAREAVARLPGYPDLRMELAIALERAGAHAEALALAVRLVPEHARIRRLDWLILMLRQAARSAEALKLAKATVAARPEDLAARLELAILLLEAGEEAEAFPHLDRLRDGKTARLDRLEEAAKAFARVGLHGDAAQAAGRLAAARAEDFSAQLLYADRLLAAGAKKDARILLRMIRRQAGNDPERMAALADRAARAGETNWAAELLSLALRPAPPPAAAPPWQWGAYMQQLGLETADGGWRRRSKARRAAHALARQETPDPAFWLALSRLFATLADFPQALRANARARALAPDDAGAKLQEAELLLAAGKAADARARLGALAVPGAARETFLGALAVLSKDGDCALARETAERWLAGFPRDAEAKLALARALFQAGDSRAARARVDEVMQRRAGDARFWSAVAELWLDLRAWPEARRAAEQALANDPGNGRRAEEIIGMARLLADRSPALAPPPAGITLERTGSRESLLSRLAGTFRRR